VRLLTHTRFRFQNGYNLNGAVDHIGNRKRRNERRNLKKMAEAVVVNSIGQYTNSELHAVR